ncbi:hypothetical protein HS327_01195 [Glaesserella parasuis]|nr:hypothetical protein HS327_01195 [Glaesserella parasuis]
MLTDSKIKSLKAKDKAYKVADRAGQDRIFLKFMI